VELRKNFSDNKIQNFDFVLIRYDFRKGADEQDEFFVNLTRLVTETYELNNQTKVVLVTHSMGGSLLLF
jgi:triacylglycerol esterase/lipase EstA (alpha/beta hydrolase family)